ncbi:DNA polymerase II [Candidatus Woesearchaeota archaeon]|nr:DNA polymerase II [Candidatus Woesearchaeota archaeon]
MKGFIVYPTYRIENGSARVYLFGRLENGESFLTINSFKPYFFIRREDLKRAEEVKEPEFKHQHTELKDFDEEAVEKIILSIPKDVPFLRKSFEEKGIKCYEADIRFAQRFLMDKSILGAVEINGNHKKPLPEEGIFVDRIYEEPELIRSEFFPELKVLSMDIETDSQGKSIFSISIYCRDYKKVLIVSNKELENAVSFDDEKSMLDAFKRTVIQLDPDIITGWSVIDFDLDFIRNKFREHKIEFRLGRIDWENRLRINTDFFRDSSANIPGRATLDGIFLLKASFVKLEDYKLGTAASEFLGEKKLIGEVSKAETIEDYYKNNPQKLVDYNLKDSELVYKVLEKTGVVKLSILRSMLTGMPLERVRASIASFDSLYLRHLRKKGYVAMSLAFAEKEEPITGGFVMKSKPGIYDYVVVLDFKSLYPSIIRTFNIDPLSFVRDKLSAKNKTPEKYVETPNGAIFKNEEGLLPSIIQSFWKQRDAAKKEKNALASNAIKILMNSFFGVLASPNCRFFSMEMSNAITHTGQFIIKLSAKYIEEKGYEVIYSDTDSLFLKLDVNSPEEAERIGRKIETDINKFMEKYIHDNYRRKSYLEIEFDKVYKKFLMPKTRGSEEGSKKRYAGLLVEDGKEKMDFTGLEFVRRDWTDLAKKFQLELLTRVFEKKEVVGYVKQFLDELKKGKYDDLLVYRKALRKGVDEYTRTTPPHVKAARKLKKISSSIIEYYMTSDGPEPAEELKHKINYEHYIEKQLKPIADSILVFYGKSFDDLVNKQKSLFEY